MGIDLSDVQIGHGRVRVQAMGLDNVELLVGDIARMDLAPLGQFDFIIAHGVYSWVPDNVQDALLAAIRRLLAPTGVAYLSYNVYPGWKVKEVMRDAMMLASGASTTPDEKVREPVAISSTEVVGRAGAHGLGLSGGGTSLHNDVPRATTVPRLRSTCSKSAEASRFWWSSTWTS